MTLAAYMRKNPPQWGSQAHLAWIAFQELAPQDQEVIDDMVDDLTSIEDIGPVAALVIVWELAQFLVKRGSI